MALTPADIEQFISALHDDAGLRERVRGAILADDFLALPGITARVEESLDRLTQRVDRLAARTDEVAQGPATLTVRTDALAQRMDQLRARMGRVRTEDGPANGPDGAANRPDEGRLYELAHLARRYRKVTHVIPADVDAVAKAYDDGAISEEEWDHLHRVDMVAMATRLTGRSRYASNATAEPRYPVR